MSIEIKNVSKAYGKKFALNGIDVTFEEDKIYGLLGRNGAGKTTLMRIISNRTFPTDGDVILDGESVIENSEAQGQIYMMSQSDLFPPSYKVKDVFRWTAEFYNGFDNELADRLCKEFKLNTNAKINKLSTGYNVIYKAICAICVNARYILMDEPVLGLDAAHRKDLYNAIIESYAQNPRTIIISTHLIEEVAGVIEDAVIINDGKLVKNDSVENLIRYGFNISGAKAKVEEYCNKLTQSGSGYEVIGTESIGGLLSAAVVGKRPENIPAELEISNLDLQNLFIMLTKEDK